MKALWLSSGSGTSGVELRSIDPTDDDHDEHEPAFSLAGELVSEQSWVPEFGESRHLEVVSMSGETVTDLQLVAPGRSFYVGPEVSWRRRLRYGDIPGRRRLAQVTCEGAWVTVNGLGGMLERAGTRQQLDVAGDVALMRPGDTVHLLAGSTTYHLRFVSPPERVRMPSTSLRQRLRSVCWPAWGGALALHLAALAIFGVLFEPSWASATPGPVVEVELDEPTRFANSSRTCSHSAPTHAGDLFPILCCLAEHDPPAYASDLVVGWTERKDGRARRVRVIPEPTPSALACVEAIVHGWRLPRRHKAERIRYEFDGLPTTPMPLPQNEYRRVGQGHLDRDAIQKVINANIGQIQRCYEREMVTRLPAQPRGRWAPDLYLSGKLQVEWTIATTGRIRTARRTYSSLQSTEVSECILRAIRRWQFPRPHGGEVVVNYPFIFKSIGF